MHLATMHSKEVRTGGSCFCTAHAKCAHHTVFNVSKLGEVL